MNSLLVSYEFPPDCGGGGRVAASLADQLDGIGHDVDLVCGDGNYLRFPLRSWQTIRNTIASKEPDVVHGVFSLPSSVFLPGLAGLADVPLIVSVMGSDVYNPRRFQRIRPLLDRVNKHVLGAADAVVAPSWDLQQRVENLGVDCQRIPHGIETSAHAWRARERHDPVRILTVSRLAPGKNVDVAIDAVRELREVRDAELRICGDGSESAPVAAAADRHDWVDWRGWVEDTAPHYDWADLFLLPSQWEAFGLVYCEALASGLPVVAAPHGGPQDIVRPSVGELAEPSVEAQAQALNWVCADYNSYQAATEGYVADRFSADKMSRQYHNQYVKLC